MKKILEPEPVKKILGAGAGHKRNGSATLETRNVQNFIWEMCVKARAVKHFEKCTQTLHVFFR